jgi:hypothetical protein
MIMIKFDTKPFKIQKFRFQFVIYNNDLFFDRRHESIISTTGLEIQTNHTFYLQRTFSENTLLYNQYLPLRDMTLIKFRE